MRVAVVGVPLDLGAARRGTDMGPGALRYARLHDALARLGHQVSDLGNLAVPVAESRAEDRPRLRYLPEICAVCADLAAVVDRTRRAGAVPVVLGGDHSVSIGTLAGYARAGERPGVLWVDAHADFNTEATTLSGNIHGMPLAAATGRGTPELVAAAGAGWLPDEAVAIVGVRDVDPEERRALRDSRVHAYTMADVDREGAASVVTRALRAATAGGRRAVHVSLDLDALDPDIAPGVGTPVPGGLTYREAHLAMEMAAASGLVCGVDVVEVNPILDAHNRTARLAVGLLASLLGERIL